MPLDLSHPCLHLHLLLNEYYVIKQEATDENWTALIQGLLPSNSSAASATGKAKFLSFTKTDEEISLVGECQADGEHKEGDWRCIKIAGPMEFELTGVLSTFTDSLRRAEIPVFAVSTYNTDYVLVPKGKVDAAVAALKKDGWQFASGTE